MAQIKRRFDNPKICFQVYLSLLGPHRNMEGPPREFSKVRYSAVSAERTITRSRSLCSVYNA